MEVVSRKTERAALTGNAADEQQVENAKREERNQREIELDDLASILDVDVGRRFLWRLLDHCGPFHTPFGLDNRITNYNVGRGDVGRFLLREIALAKPGALVQMMTEFGEHA